MPDNYRAHTFYIFYGKVNCTGGTFNLSVLVDYNTTDTNELSTALNTSISLHRFCFKQITEENVQPIVIKCNRSESINETKPALSLDDNRDIIMVYGIVSSLPFLFLTIVTYALIKELRNTFGMLLMFYTATMMINNILIIFRHFDTGNVILRKIIVINEYKLYFIH